MPLSGIINGVANKQPKREWSARYCEMLSVCSCELVRAHLLAAFQKVVGCQGCCRLRGAQGPAQNSQHPTAVCFSIPEFISLSSKHECWGMPSVSSCDLICGSGLQGCQLLQRLLSLTQLGIISSFNTHLFFSAWISECLCLWQTHYYNLVNKRLS